MAASVPNQTCVVCCHDTSIWAIGECNHPTCLLCCARMRVLCDQKDCPVCRMSLEQVLVSPKIQTFRDTPYYHNWPSDTKYGLFFQTRELFTIFRTISENRCCLCPTRLQRFTSFRKLKDHVGKVHNCYFCEICVDNLKLFPSEFKVYSRSKLTAHRRDGDADDKSYKGHPYCQFCDERYLDNDTLHMHLRKNHFWCHFCEADGRQDFYLDHHSLRAHFKLDHFLCEDGNCRDDILTSAFKNEIDIRAHRASAHRKGMSKAEAKQTRVVPVEFSFNRSSGDDSRRRGFPTRGGVGGNGGSVRDERFREVEERELATALSSSLHTTEKTKKAAKTTPPPPRKKVCGQEKDEVPPKHETQKKLKNGCVQKVKPGKPPRSNPPSEAESLGNGIRDEPPPGKIANLSSETWPSLDGLTEQQQSNSIPPGFCVEIKRDPPLPPGFHLEEIKDDPPLDSVITKEKGVDSSIVLHPTGYSSNRKEETRSIHSHRGFPTLVLKSKSFSISSSSSSSSSSCKNTGSRIFEDIRQALDHDKSKFTTFQNLSGRYRSGDLSINDYCAQCEVLFGPRWENVGPDFANKVMPPGKKREQLLASFGGGGAWGDAHVSRKRKGKSKNSSHNAWKSSDADDDAVNHRSHLKSAFSEKDYPSLSVASKTTQPSKVTYNAWNIPIHS